MTVCNELHALLNDLPRYSLIEDLTRVPTNGVYVVFEEGEVSHSSNRVVRVGTHTGPNNLKKRIFEHLFRPNKDRSIFRKHVGRCILSLREDPFYEFWNLDMTTRDARLKYGSQMDREKLELVEEEVTEYMVKFFSFSVLETINDRLKLESTLLSTFSQCPECRPSSSWLGRHHPDQRISLSGLWNIQGTKGPAMKMDELATLQLGQGSR